MPDARALRSRLLALLLALPVMAGAAGGAAAPAAKVPARAGETTLWFNLGALAPLGMVVQRDCGGCSDGGSVADYRELRFAAAAGEGLRWRREDGRFAAIERGAMRHAGGPRLQLGDRGRLDLNGFQLRQRGGSRVALELADAAGRTWFTLDHAHVHVGDDGSLALRHMDLRIAPALAQRLGHAEWSGRLVGGAQTEGRAGTAVDAPASKQAAACTVEWPSATAKADVRMLRLAQNWEEREPDGVNAYRCGRDDGQGGHTRSCSADSSDGLVVLAPDASLRNEGNASVAWHPKFSPPSPPYANDQHPYLVWNLYRLDADGRLSQVGLSGAKHAFHTINAACGCAGGEILYPSCEDTYGGFSNDFASGLGPRQEIIPYTARWGRCGSLYDKDCDGQRDADNGQLPDDAYNPVKRLAVRERELLPAQHPGARWFLEYWYVVREDSEPWNNIGLMEIEPYKVRGQGSDPNAWIWRFDAVDFHNGSMLQRWLDLAPATSLTRSAVVQTEFGRAQLATRVDPLPDGRYRYQYQLFNLDLSRARTEGQDPNLRIVENRGLERFGVWTPPQEALEQLEFAPVADSGVAWSAVQGDGRLDWNAGGGAALDWGRTFRFGFVSATGPSPSVAQLALGESIWNAATLAPLPELPPPPRRRWVQ